MAKDGCHQIKKGFNNLQRNVAVALYISKAFDTVNIHKLTLTNIPNPIIIKFLANYVKERQACTQYNDTLSKLKQINKGVLQGGVLCPT